ncbi:MAG: RloB domain-containing protein [Flavobacteriaceae bacterium]|nr:RloB domain-containing protein [Flavobacteriaceae bacterium]
MSSRRRKPRGKKINPTLFIFCEGETEVSYINLLKTEYRIPSIHIHPKIGGNNITAEYIDNYKKSKPTDEKDMTFLFYDLDVPTMQQRLLLIDDSILLVSNPSIELWFLLHYKNQTSSTNNAYCLKELKNRNRIYKKGLIDNKLKEKLTLKRDDAIKRAKKLIEIQNPSSTVYRLIEILNKLKK